MINSWKIFLSGILIASFTITTKEVHDQLTINNTLNSPFHPDIKITESVTANIQQEGDLPKDSVKEATVGETWIDWTMYANSWEQFKSYYKNITLSATGYADGKGAEKQSFSNVNIPIANIVQQSNWHTKEQLRASGSKYCLAYANHSFTWGSYDQAGVYYDAIVANNNIKFKFYLWTRGYQWGSGSIWTQSYLKYTGGVVSSSWKIDTIKESLTTALKNPINLTSDYSGSLEDANNIIDPTGKGNDETTLLTSVIAKILGNEYQDWKQYIQPYSFNNTTRIATTIIKFPDPSTNQQQVWEFQTPVNITLSSDYWGKNLSQRLHIDPGKIVNPEDSTKGMVFDVGLQLEPDQVTDKYGGNIQYHTTAHVEFDGAEDGKEWMTVNGQRVEVLENKFIYDMVDNRIHKAENTINVYDIIVYRDNGDSTEQYQIKYTISNLVPTLEAKWYAWNPEKNPDQKKLITPSLPNDKPNPDYDKEINIKTGTKTQIIWVKKKSQYPFPLDPLNKSGEVINPDKNREDYDLGFLAEGSVAGKGIQQLFNSSDVTNVFREAVDNALNQFPNPNDKQKLTAIIPDGNNNYWSWRSMWHYITRTSDGLAYEKYVLIGPDYNNKYPRFLDVLDDSTIAVDFWTTIHGIHLKNYLVLYKNLDSADIAELNYEQVASYWKEYTSDVITQRIPPNPDPSNYQDLSKILFSPIVMNLNDIDLIKQEIINQIKGKMSGTKLIYEQDYELKPFDDTSIARLLDYDHDGNATIELNITAIATSTRAIGSNKIIIINNIHYNPDEVIDLEDIVFKTQRFNFSRFSAEELRTWILKDIDQTFVFYKINLIYPNEYGIKPIDDQTLKQFLASTEVTKLTITIYTVDFLKTKNSTTLELINDPDAPIVPPDPPGPDPNPNPNPNPNESWFASSQNLIILSVIVGLLVGGTGTTIFLKHRMKKGIGGKKVKNDKEPKNKDDKN